MKTYRRLLIVVVTIVTLTVTFSNCLDAGRQKPDLRGTAYAGAATCESCHKNISDSYFHHAHQVTSSQGSLTTIKGSFDTSKNTFHYRPNLYMRMEKRDSGLYQVAYLNEKAQQAFPIDVVIGSGRKAQTYLYWYDDNVFQLPISYSVKVNNWVNSPNYPPDKIRFDRLINVGCFECHGSYIKRKGTQQEGNRLVDYFDKTKIIYGIDCERCHGPAAEHVRFHEENPQEKKPHAITNISSLSRVAKIELCAQCHSGGQTIKESLFTFKPGDSLSAFFSNNIWTPADAATLDVHGKQFQLLKNSECFIKSNVLDCSSCHNPHAKERDNMEIFSQRCMNCHSEANHNFCKMAPQLNGNIVKNCIDCHMPAAPSKVISMKSETETDANPNLVRTHFISIYPEIAKQLADSMFKK